MPSYRKSVGSSEMHWFLFRRLPHFAGKSRAYFWGEEQLKKFYSKKNLDSNAKPITIKVAATHGVDNPLYWHDSTLYPIQ